LNFYAKSEGRRFVSPQPAGSHGPRQGAGDLGGGLTIGESDLETRDSEFPNPSA